MKKGKCMHGLDVDEYGNHINIEPEKVSKSETLQMSSAEIMAEAQKLIEYNNSKKEPVTVTPKPLTKQQQAFQSHVRKWREYFEENKGKIPNEFPKTIFDKDASQ